MVGVGLRGCAQAKPSSRCPTGAPRALVAALPSDEQLLRDVSGLY
jgi:hypothetical protein